jgi:hypothetical protein
MAVPTSGALSMKDMAQEALYGTWGSGTITSPISLYDLVNGGNTGGSGNTYPTVNSGCTPNPVTRGSTPLLQIYKVEQGQPTIGPITLYVNSNQAATASDLSEGDILFTDSSLQTLFGQWDYVEDSDYFKYLYQSETNLTTAQKICGLGNGCNIFSTDSFSAVKDLICGCP